MERGQVKPPTPNKDGDHFGRVVQQYAEPHLTCENVPKLLTGKIEPIDDENMNCTTFFCAQNSVPDQVPQTYTNLSLQHQKDPTTLVAEAHKNHKLPEFQNTSAQMGTPWRNSQASVSDNHHGSHYLDANFYTVDQRIDEPSEKDMKEVKDVHQKLEKADKRKLVYWERKGLSTEGILLNKKMLLCLLTPDKVLWKYFTKVQGSLHPDLDMDPGMRRAMSALYEKVFERELSAIDGKVSMKFGRAFIAQELKGKKFNWAQYALSEHIRISEKNAKKVQRKRHSKQQFADSDQDDDDANFGLDDEDDAKFQGSSRRVIELDPDDSEISAMQDASNHYSSQVHQPSTGPERQTCVQNNIDIDLQSLRADLKRRLMQTNVLHETLRDFDNHVFRYISDSGRVEQEKEDLNLAFSMVEHKCKLLESNVSFVLGKIEMEKGCVENGSKKLQDVIARKPSEPERDYPSWKRWCTDLQQHYKYLGYSKHELVEQEHALKKLQSEHEGALAERRMLLRKLIQLDESKTPESVAESDEDQSKGLKRRRMRL